MTLPFRPQIMRPTYGIRTLAAFGDSITANGLSTTTTLKTFTPTGYLTWVNILSRQRFSSPATYNQGVAGNTTTQMLARIRDLLALDPDICIVLAGTNDLAASTSADTIIDNLTKIYTKLINQGCLVVAVPILGSTSGVRSALTSSQIKTGLSVNAWIRNLSLNSAQRSLVVADCGVVFDDPTSSDWAPRSGYTADGLHPNGVGAYAIGQKIVDVLSPIFPDWLYPVTSPADVYDATYATNGNLLPGGMFIGSGGTLGGISGTLADGWASSNSQLKGSTATGSVVTLGDGRSAQEIVMSGTFTGTGGNCPIFKALSTSNFAAGDIVQAQIEFSLDSGSQGIHDLMLVISSTEGGTTYQYRCGGGGQAWPTDKDISGVLCTPTRTLTAVPTAISVFAYIDFTDGSSSTMDGTVNWYSASLRKI